MKKLLKSLIPLGLLVGVFVSASPAQAVTLTPVTHNTITCNKHEGGTYPEDGHFFSCGTNPTTDAKVLAAAKGVMAAYSQVRTKFGTTNVVSYYVVDKATDLFLFTSGAMPLPPAVQTFYDNTVGGIAYSNTAAPYQVAVFNRQGTAKGNSSQPTAAIDFTQQSNDPGFSALHETGHLYDLFLGHKSDSQLYLQLTEKDQIAFDVFHSDNSVNSAQKNRVVYSYWLTRDHTAPNSPTAWHELYAQEFAAYVQKNNPTISGPHPIQADVFDQANGAFECTGKVIERNVLAGTDPNSVQLGSIGCSMPPSTPPSEAVPVLCFEYRPTSHKGYPTPDPRTATPLNSQFEFNSFYCGRTTNAAKDTGTPSPARRTELFDGLATKLQTVPNAEFLVENNRVKYYFFNNKAEAIAFFKYQGPYSANNLYQGNNSQARCGSTFWNSSGVKVAVAIYDNCEVLPADGGSIQNPDLVRSAVYQTGHAYNWAIESTLGSASRPDSRPGFVTYFNDDSTKIGVSSGVFAGYSEADKSTMVCQAFGVLGNSKLERALGATTTSGQTGPVCTAGGVNPPWRTGSVPPTWHDPTVIAGNDHKIPSAFLTSGFPKREIWAEVFTLIVMGGPAPAPVIENWLPITDKLFSTTSFPTAGSPPRAFNCTRTVIESYVATGAPPAPVAGCPPVSAGDL